MDEGRGHDEVALDHVEVGVVAVFDRNISLLVQILSQELVEEVADEQDQNVNVVDDDGLQQN